MRPLHPVLQAVLIPCAMAGCASMSGGVRDATTYTADLGTVAFESLTRGMEEVLVDRYGFALAQREAQYASVYYATEWSEIAEEERGSDAAVTAARERIVIRGRRSDGYYRVSFHGERRIRTRTRPEWHRAPIPGAFERRMDEIVDALDMAIRSGVTGAPVTGPEPGGGP